jgi:superfamily II DNA or RNA helicase
MRIFLSHNLELEGVPTGIRDMLVQQLRMENPRWIENERMGRWNRTTPHYLEFFEMVSGNRMTVPRGYLRRLLTACRENGVQTELIDQRRRLADTPFSFRGELRPFQRVAVETMLARQFGTLCAPTGSGKTVMAACMIAERSQPALIVVHTRELGLQWIQRLSDFLDISPEEIGFVGGGKKDFGARITVALVQTLYKCAEAASRGTGFLIVDECHRCPSRTFTEAVSHFDSYYMLGLSATPYRRDGLSSLIFHFLGDIHHRVDQKGLEATGDILKAEVVQKETGFKPYFDPVREYSKMLAELTADDQRNRLIAEDVFQEALQQNGVCLVLSDRKHHCETLRAVLQFRYGIQAELLTGDVPEGERSRIVDRIRSGGTHVLIATGQLVGEGFDCPGLSTLFLATPIRFSGRVIQYIGRILRPAPGKRRAKIYDYVDIHVGVLKHAADARMRIYRP